MVTKGRRRKVTNVQISPLSSFVPAPTPPPYTHSTSLEPGNHKSVRLLHCIRGVTVSTSTIRQNMKCQSRPRSKVPTIKGHSRFMILSDGLTDHGHESMSRSSLCIFKKRFLKAFLLPCLNHAAIQHSFPRADNACSIVAIIKPATSHRQLPCLQKTRRERKDWCWDMIEAG